jgi:tetratricopeptide (TPR) repeat protein/tRNA A-37 threonylcarbamoyl transferase component Bud32
MNGAAPSLPPEAWARLEPILDRFENAWKRGEPPALEDFLTYTGAERRALLIELVHEDLEYRLKAGEQVRVESYLERFPELRSERPVALDLIAAEYVLRRRREPNLAPEEYLQRFPEVGEVLLPHLEEYAQREAQAGPQLRRSEGQETVWPTSESESPANGQTPASVAPAPEAEPGATEPGRIPGYEILGELGRGGMGVVYKARQIKLNRVVALKMILAGNYAGPEELARFRREAEAVARLQHPHIVQIHEVGEADGRPFFSLEYVEGGSLADKLDGTPLPPRQAAELVETLARAVQAAHERGVVHRDLKPANVLLTAEEQPKVTDFGLAKRIDQEKGQVQSGAIVGTASYMPPEQAGGQPGAIGPATDVYALGSILYEVLTGRPPFQGATVWDTLEQVFTQEPVPPSRLQPKVPRDLETICLKCLHKAPAKRYASGLALAEDLRRFRVGEPILARPVGLLERTAKWARRKPAAAVAVGLLLASIAGLALGLFIVERERKRAEQALVQEAKRKQQARDVLDAMTSELIDDLLAKQPKLTDPQRHFLRHALRAYEEFAADTGLAEDERAGVARAYGRAADIRQRLGQDREAAAAYRTCLDLLQRLANDFSGAAGYQKDLGTNHLNLGHLLAHLGQHAEAQKEYRAAQGLFAPLAEQFPSEPAYLLGLAKCHNNLGIILRDLGRRGEAEKEYRAALAIQERLAGQFPDRSGYRNSLALTHMNRGLMLADLGRRDEAEQEYRAAVAIQERLTKESPDDPAYRLDLAKAHLNLGALFMGMKRFEDAAKEARAALLHWERLVEQFPAVPSYRIAMSYAYSNQGAALAELGRRDEAEKALRAAHRLKQGIAEQFPKVPNYRRDLAMSHHNLGSFMVKLRRFADAEKEYAAAIRLKKKLCDEFPKVSEYAWTLGNSYKSLADLCRDHNRAEDARTWYGKAISTLQPLYEGQRLAAARRSLCAAHAGRAEVLTRLDHHADAMRDWKRAADLAEGPDRTIYQAHRAYTLVRMGDRAAAVAEAERLTALKGLPADTLYQLARLYAVVSAADVSRKKIYADRAVDLLRSSVAAGFKNFTQLKKETDLDPIRSRKDFQELLATVTRQAKPGPVKP